ncbi:CDR ABC transporter [Phytophthora cactorum]|nr:CDR ABC transporter [Phytophthora cactorum]
MDDAPVTVGHTTPKEYTEDYFGMEHDKILRNFAIVIGYMLLFRVVVYYHCAISTIRRDMPRTFSL